MQRCRCVRHFIQCQTHLHEIKQVMMENQTEKDTNSPRVHYHTKYMLTLITCVSGSCVFAFSCCCCCFLCIFTCWFKQKQEREKSHFACGAFLQFHADMHILFNSACGHMWRMHRPRDASTVYRAHIRHTYRQVHKDTNATVTSGFT